MEPTTMGLDEVVVVGYGTQSKRTVTSAISKVGWRNIEGNSYQYGEGLKGKIAVYACTMRTILRVQATFLIRGAFIRVILLLY